MVITKKLLGQRWWPIAKIKVITEEKRIYQSINQAEMISRPQAILFDPAQL